jgi:hypothetical protein
MLIQPEGAGKRIGPGAAALGTAVPTFPGGPTTNFRSVAVSMAVEEP